MLGSPKRRRVERPRHEGGCWNPWLSPLYIVVCSECSAPTLLGWDVKCWREHMPRDLSSEVYILADTKFVAVQHCSEFRFDRPQTRGMIVVEVISS